MPDILLFLIGLILIFVPRTWLRLGKGEWGSKKRRPSDGMRRDRQPDDKSFWPGEEFARRRNWLDLGRATAGGLALVASLPGLVESFLAVPGDAGTRLVLPIKGGIMLAAVLVQTLRFEGRLTFFPPVFFIAGLAFATIGWKTAILAFVAVWAINTVLPNPGVFLVAYGGIALILSVFLDGDLRSAVLMGALAGFPTLLSLLARRRLAQYKKRTKVVVR